LQETNKQFQETAKATNKLIPELQQTNKQIQKLVQTTDKTVPELNKTLDEIQRTASNWSKVGERLDVLLQTNEKKFTKALDDLNKSLEGMAQVFGKENQDNLSEILKNASKTSKQLDTLVKETDQLLKQSNKTIAKVSDAVEKADRVFDNLEKTTKPMAERSEKILKNLDEATEQLNKAMGEFRTLMQGVTKSEGTIYKLLNDPQLYNQLNEAAGLATKVLPRLDRIMHDIEVFADKIARHPELLGVGGAIRPSTGLKDLPPYPTIWKAFP
jgi:phospholipid/cholesterol/gamma-HCH transport system substrate-binding protein